MNEDTCQGILKKCSERGHLLRLHPLYFLVLVFEERCFEYKEWFDKILEEINVVESATGMTLSTWKKQLPDKLMDWFSDYDNLLRTLYASHTELSHFDTVTTFSIKIGKFLLETLAMLEDLRVETGLARLSKREYGALQQRIQFSLSRCESTCDKTREMMERVKGQINVVSGQTEYNHIKLNVSFTYVRRLLVLCHKETARSTLPLRRIPIMSRYWQHGIARQ